MAENLSSFYLELQAQLITPAPKTRLHQMQKNPMSSTLNQIGIERVKMPVNELTLGMYVAELDRPWIESPFMIQGFVLKDQEDIRKVQEVCRYVYIDVMRERVSSDTKGSSYVRTRYVDKSSCGAEINRASETYGHARCVLNDIYQSIRMNSTFDTQGAKTVVKACVESIVSNAEAMLWLTLIKNVDEYTAEHSLNVCVLSIALGRKVGLLPQELEDIGVSGLLHDIGKARIPLEVLNKEGALSEEEFELMKSHPIHGRRLLLGKRGIFPGAVDVAFGHHERLSGKGYPRGLSAKNIGYFTRIVAIVDAYDAITSDRIYSQAKPMYQALRILAGASGSHFDAELVKQFIDLIGLYPAGSIAELSSGEIGIVLPVSVRFKSMPKVLIVLDSEKKPCKERVLDLAKQNTLADCSEYKINNLLPDGSFGVFIKDYHKNGLVLSL